MLRLPLVLVVLSVASSGCDSDAVASQRLFEDSALASPVEGITAIDARGVTTRTDPGDWRIGPAYQSDIRFAFLPSPNPASRSDVVSFQLVSAFSDALPSLAVRLLTIDPRTGEVTLPVLAGVGCQAGGVSCSVSIRPSQVLDRNGPGVSRLIVTSGLGFVTYGDVQVREE